MELSKIFDFLQGICALNMWDLPFFPNAYQDISRNSNCYGSNSCRWILRCSGCGECMSSQLGLGRGHDYTFYGCELDFSFLFFSGL